MIPGQKKKQYGGEDARAGEVWGGNGVLSEYFPLFGRRIGKRIFFFLPNCSAEMPAVIYSESNFTDARATLPVSAETACKKYVPGAAFGRLTVLSPPAIVAV